jgi:hypothetical protein
MASATADGRNPTGSHTIFESGHITQLFDAANLQVGDFFVLKFASTDTASGFNRFALQKIKSSGAAVQDDDIPDFSSHRR